MLLLLSADKNLVEATEALAAYYNESGYSTLHEDAFKNQTDLSRLTVIGHAGKNSYGDALFTPEQFVDELIKNGLSESVKIIDLIGCEIGFMENGTCYAKRVAELLSQRGFDIQVNAFTNVEQQQDLYRTLVFIHMDGKIHMTGCVDTPENRAKDADIEQQVNHLTHELNVLKAQAYEEVAGGPPTFSEADQKRMEELQAQLQKANDDLVNFRSEITIYGPSLCDMRLELDKWPTFQFDSKKFAHSQDAGFAAATPTELEVPNNPILDNAKSDVLMGLDALIESIRDTTLNSRSSFFKVYGDSKDKLAELMQVKSRISNDTTNNWTSHLDHAMRNSKLNNGYMGGNIKTELEKLKKHVDLAVQFQTSIKNIH